MSMRSCTSAIYCLDRDIQFTPFGSWLLKESKDEAGIEPDECFVFGSDPGSKPKPDLAIEVAWTRGGVDKLAIYARFRVDEVWIWKRESITIHGLVGDRYEPRATSAWVPDIDLVVLCEIAQVQPTNDAIKQLRERMLKPSSDR
jgi:Uma2 family endonuclease